MKDGGFWASAAAPNFEDSCNICMDFPIATMEHCDREANQVAHELARQAFVSKVFFCTWVDSPPSFIFPILSKDVTMFSDE